MASFAEDQEEYDNSNDNIWVAASNGDVERVNVLLSSGISVNAQDEYGYSPM
jgi:ankyrin repeat protein